MTRGTVYFLNKAVIMKRLPVNLQSCNQFSKRKDALEYAKDQDFRFRISNPFRKHEVKKVKTWRPVGIDKYEQFFCYTTVLI